jgi:putative FmdB family regulatory protein
MPLYEYLCKKCRQSFAFTMTVSEHEKKRDQCPHCNSTEIVPQSSRFSRRLQKKADDGSSRGSHLVEFSRERRPEMLFG